MVHHWQRARETEADRTSVCIWFRSKLHRRSAKHLGTRLKLNMHFQADGSEVVHSMLRGTLRSCRIIKRGVKIEFLDAICERGIICGIDDPLILKKVEKTLLRDDFRDVRVITYSNNFRMLTQRARARK